MRIRIPPLSHSPHDQCLQVDLEGLKVMRTGPPNAAFMVARYGHRLTTNKTEATQKLQAVLLRTA